MFNFSNSCIVKIYYSAVICIFTLLSNLVYAVGTANAQTASESGFILLR